MKIIDKKEYTTLFKNVNIGEVFKMNDDSNSNAYMKIIPVSDKFDKKYDAVCLNDGDLRIFGDDRQVFTYPYTELIIKR
jgi:hypothetical protein